MGLRCDLGFWICVKLMGVYRLERFFGELGFLTFWGFWNVKLKSFDFAIGVWWMNWERHVENKQD